MKKTIASLLAIICVLTSCMGAYATNNKMQKNEQPLSDSFVNMCNRIFETGDTFEVKNKNGEDITDEFYYENLENFNNNDLQAIWGYFTENVSSIGATTESISTSLEGSSFRAPYEHKTITNHMLYATKTINTQQDVAVSLDITGTFYYNGNTYEISNYNTPTLTLGLCSSIGPNNDSTNTMYNTSVQGSISADRSSITFTGSTQIKFTYYENGVLKTDYAGPFVIAVTGTP